MRRLRASAPGSLNGQSVSRLPVFVCALRGFACLTVLACWAQPVSARSLDVSGLEEVAQLARQGAPQLALKQIDRTQPDPGQQVATWVAWEQERLQIMRIHGMHEDLVRRIDAMPATADALFQRTALSLKAESQLDLDDPQAARATLRSLLWSGGPAAEPVQLERWRRMVVRSYLLEGRLEDARLALSRYRQDFGDENPEWRWLSAAVALRSGQAESALKLLDQDDSTQGRLLRFSARLETTPQAAAAIEAELVEVAGKSTESAAQRMFWGLAAGAAARAGEPEAEILYLERALCLPAVQGPVDLELDLTADRLWLAYQSRGQAIGNQEQRLLGNDADWYFPATEAVSSDPLRARILFAVLAEHAADEKHRALAHEYLLELLSDLPGGRRLVQQLYLDSNTFGDIGGLPEAVRYRLVDEALEAGRFQLASGLMSGLAAPPAEGARFEWQLRRARVNVFAGRISAGVELLEQLLAEHQAWEPQQVDRLLQVLFDLQTINRHAEALQLFESLAAKQLDTRQMRELLFWMAESRQALEQHEQAALLYLRSAGYPDPLAMDPWAQTARYQAARALARAGLVDDARRLYTSLLNATRESDRRTLLENEIQRLRLVPGDAGG